MNEYEENIYKEIKNELVQSVIDKKIDTYFTNKNELTHYYNVGKKIIDAQGGEEKAEYGNRIIKNEYRIRKLNTELKSTEIKSFVISRAPFSIGILNKFVFNMPDSKML